MKSALKFVIALMVTTLLMLAFRALFFTIYTVEGHALEPTLISGDRVLVNRWSYGLRTGGGGLFKYTRWMGRQPLHGDLVAFNFPLDSTKPVADRPVYICFCKALPGDSVTTGGTTFTVPGRNQTVRVTDSNRRLLSYLYNRYEDRKATVKDSTLYVDGRATRCASFKKDYYWMVSGQRGNFNDSRFFGLVPEDHLIGKVTMLLYSVDDTRPVYDCLRTDRTLWHINSGHTAARQTTAGNTQP